MNTPARLAFLVPLAAACLLGTALAQSPERAEELYKRGREAIVNNQFPQAYEALSEAWKLRRSYDIAALLGQSEYHLKKYPEAAEHLSFSLRGFPASETGSRRKRVETALADARKHVLELELTVSESGADVFVDGRPIGRAPLDGPVFLSPGRHTIESKLDGFEPATVASEGSEGERKSITVRLQKSSQAAAAPSASASAGAPLQPDAPDAGAPVATRPAWPAYAAGGLAVVGLGLGTAFLVMAHGKAADRDDVLRGVESPNACGAGTPYASECARAQKLGDDAKRDQALAQGAFVFAGVAAAFTAAYLLWPQSKGPAVTGYVGPAGGGLSVSGRF